MKNNFIFMLGILGAILPQTFAFADDRSERVPEVMLMPLMEEAPLEGSRPGETAATIHGNDKMVLTYYFQHLQDEGWESMDPQHTQYKRGEQSLGLGVMWDKPTGITTVRFKIWPVTGQPEKTETPTPTPEEIIDGTTQPEGQ